MMKKIIRIFPVIVIAFNLIFFTSCSNNKKAVGKEDEIIVLADSALYYEVEAEMLQVFEKIIYTPQPENLFNLIRKNYTSLNSINKRKNIIILGTLNDSGYVSQYIQSSLDSAVTEMISSNQEYVINKYDMWAQDQLVMYLVSPTVNQLRTNILSGHEELFYSFRNISDNRLSTKLSNHRAKNEETEAQLLNDYGWTIYVLKYFELAKNSAEDQFVWLRTGRNTPMERWIFVHWIENASTDYLHNDSISIIRNRITKQHYNTSEVSEYIEISSELSPPVFSEVNYNSKYAIMTQGFWRFNDKSGGGPFTSYSFYDEKTQRFYMIDGSIYAPKYYKKELIHRVDVLLNSFRTIDDLTEQESEELLEELD
ncbi:MAG: DUF4837 family protein [Bacteroidota bacterium]